VGRDSIVVRLATRADEETVTGLWSDLLREEASLDTRFRPSPDAFDRWGADYSVWLQDATRLLAVAEIEAVVAGFVSAHLWNPEPILEERIEAFVEYLFVRPGQRRGGIGTALVNRVAEWASSLGASRLRLRSLARSEEASLFWRSHGADPFSVEMLLDLGEPAARSKRAPIGFLGNST
jgi:GNAT superfamily N-acetyltransferase